METETETVTDTEPVEPAETYYIVLPGDCLWNIAKQVYGTGTMWDAIYRANLEQIEDPNWIRIGQKLVMP